MKKITFTCLEIHRVSIIQLNSATTEIFSRTWKIAGIKKITGIMQTLFPILKKEVIS